MKGSSSAKEEVDCRYAPTSKDNTIQVHRKLRICQNNTQYTLYTYNMPYNI